MEQPRVALAALFARAQTKIEAIVTFMAILELIRLKEIVALQKRMFDEIELVRNRDNIVPESDEHEDDDIS